MAQEAEQSWEHQPGESASAFKAFCVFRDLPRMDPPRRRSRRAASEVDGHSRPTINGWAAKWNWEERARDYDNELQRIEMDERKEQIRLALENKIKIGKALQGKALKALAELPQEVLSARNVLDYLAQGVGMEHDALLELVGGLGAASGGKGSGGIIADMNEPEESTMMQLVRSLEAARKKKEQ